MTTEMIIAKTEAQWMGRMESPKGRIVLFRDPLTGSSCVLPELGITVAAVVAKLRAKRKEFGR